MRKKTVKKIMLNDADGELISDGEPGPSLEACLEAILLVVDEPVAEVVLAQVLEIGRASCRERV